MWMSNYDIIADADADTEVFTIFCYIFQWWNIIFLKNIIDFQMAATFVTMYCVIVVSYCYDEFQLNILLKTHVKNVAWNLVQIE